MSWGGVDDNVAGMETVYNSVMTGDGFAFGGLWPGRLPGVLLIGGNLFFARRHSTVLYQ